MNPKEYLKNINRLPNEQVNRLEYLRLDKNENLLPLPESILTEIKNAITPDFISAYPCVYTLHEELSRRLGIDMSLLYLTAGSDAAIKSVFEAYISPGDMVIMTDPTYAMFDVYGNLFQSKIKKVTYDKNLELPVSELINAIKPGVKLICLPNPDSPTGTILSRATLIEIISVAKDAGSLVLIDEAYYYFYHETMADRVPEFDNLIITRTFSKAFGLASARLGYAIASPVIIEALVKFRPMYEINAFAVLLGKILLDHPEWLKNTVQTVNESKNFIEEEVSKLGFTMLPSFGNFVLIRVGSEKVNQIVKVMGENKILMKGNFSHPGMSDCIRISVGPISLMQIFINALKQAFKA